MQLPQPVHASAALMTHKLLADVSWPGHDALPWQHFFSKDFITRQLLPGNNTGFSFSPVITLREELLGTENAGAKQPAEEVAGCRTPPRQHRQGSGLK